jgi:hypothetical protein
MKKHTLISASKIFIVILLGTASLASADQTKSISNSTANTERKSAQQLITKSGVSAQLNRRQIPRTQQSKKNFQANQLSSQPPMKTYRAQQPIFSANSHWYSIYDSRIFLNRDFDGDGYYSEFTVEFDADVSGGYADVYAKLYLSRAGGSWVHYHTTDAFTIYAGDDFDDYSVTTRLQIDFPTADYDILIDLYEAGFDDIVDSFGPAEDADLYAIPLEDSEHELGNDDTDISAVGTTLFYDVDHDGFYTDLSIEYDIDTIVPGINVYTEITLTHRNELWQHIITTDVFRNHNQTEVVDISLDSGFDAAWYDIEIKIIDNYSGQLLATAAQEFSSLTKVPMESIDYDDFADSPPYTQPFIDGSESTSNSESGGGALNFGLLLLATLGAIRKIIFKHKG